MKELRETIKQRIKEDNGRFWANDNISKYIKPEEKQALIEEAIPAFENVLQSLLIDTETDPNSQDTARRMAKMYINEIMSGRYDPMPNPSAFPNYIEGGYEGMLVVRSELKSICSHHHQPVAGTLQEELNVMIANKIQEITGTEHVGVYVQATHGCCENRGIMAKSSLTQTTVLRGDFKDIEGTKKEFMDNVKLQQEFAKD